MSDSDDDYVDSIGANQEGAAVQTNGYGTRGRSGAAGVTGSSRERWEDVRRTWDEVEEGQDGSLAQAIEGMTDANKRKRILKDTTPLQRGIIRHLILLVDLSRSITETDLKPSRLHLVLNTVTAFVTQFFSQNPISQLALLITRDGLVQRLTDLSGSPSTHLAALEKLRPKPDPEGKSGYKAEIEAKGRPTLQNSLSLACAMLSAAPSHGTREVLVVYSAIETCDSGNIHDVIRALVTERVRVSVISLAARMAICTELVTKTHGIPSTAAPQASADNVYGVALDEVHFRTLLMGHTTPPPTFASEQATGPPSMIPMGFPSRVDERVPGLCMCHLMPSRTGYLCPRCGAKLCSLPMQCPICSLQCVQSTHLARSFHHLFPLKNFTEVSWDHARAARRKSCFGCQAPFPQPPDENGNAGMERRASTTASKGKKPETKRAGGVSESGRYACTECGEHFCIDCDVLAHETLHNCAGCLARPPWQK